LNDDDDVIPNSFSQDCSVFAVEESEVEEENGGRDNVLLLSFMCLWSQPKFSQIMMGSIG